MFKNARLRIIAAVLLVLLLGAWATVIEPRWVARRDLGHEVAQWQGPAGLKVAVASDWHLTKRAYWRVMTVERARRIVEEINAAQPDVILLPATSSRIATIGRIPPRRPRTRSRRLPLIGAPVIPTAAPRDWAYGWIAHGHNRMYVTSGLGVSILPLRLNMRPEWALFTVNGAAH